MPDLWKSRLVGVLLVTGISLMLVACAQNNQNNLVADTRSNADLLKQAAENMKVLKSYHANAIEVIDGKTSNTMRDIDIASGKLRDSGGGEDGNGVIIQIENDNYLSFDGGHSFEKGTSMQTAKNLHEDRWKYLTAQEIDKAIDKLHDGSPAIETINGLVAKHIVVNIKDLEVLNIAVTAYLSLSEGTIDVWVSRDDHPLILKASVKSKDHNINFQGTVTWSRFNESLDIQAPPNEAVQGLPTP